MSIKGIRTGTKPWHELTEEEKKNCPFIPARGSGKSMSIEEIENTLKLCDEVQEFIDRARKEWFPDEQNV